MTTEPFVLYTSAQSQWARVAHLGLEEKGFREGEYLTQWIDLVAAENFAPDYVDVNPQATVPSLKSPSLEKPLVDSVSILQHLDRLRPAATTQLASPDAEIGDRTDRLISLVHSDKMHTNLILLQARDPAEMQEKQKSIWKIFVNNRQDKLSRLSGPGNKHGAMYASRLEQNSKLYELYNSSERTGSKYEGFYKQSTEAYEGFARGLKELDELLVLPYATGEHITYADLHIVPWLAHAMWGSGGSEVLDFGCLEAVIGRSVTDFKIGSRVREWWKNMSTRAAFQKVYPVVA